MKTPLPEILLHVAEDRAAYTALKTEFDGNKNSFDLKNADLLSRMHAAKTKMDQTEDIARSAALEVYNETQDKKPATGIEVKLFVGTVLKYDYKQAKDWAVEKGICLDLNVTAFEKVAPHLGLDFVEVLAITTPKAQISTKL